jgi:hypothetical protein
MRIELSDGEMLEVSEPEAETLYGALLERTRQFGATSAARKLRSALSWSGGAGTKVAFNRSESDAVRDICRRTSSGDRDRSGS